MQPVPPSVLWFSTVLAACIPVPSSRPPATPAAPTTLNPASREQLVARWREVGSRVPRIDRGLEPSARLYTTYGGIRHVDTTSEGNALGVGYGGDFTELAFAGTRDDKLCFVFDMSVGATGEKKIKQDVLRGIELRPLVLYAVGDLAAWTGPAWPAPADASSFDSVALVQVDVDDRDQRYAIIELCAPAPTITDATRYLVVQQHDAHADLTFEPVAGVDNDEVKRNRPFFADMLKIWELAGTAVGASHDQPARPRPDDATPTNPSSVGKAMTLSSATIQRTEKLRVDFDGPMQALPGEKYWITIVTPTAPETTYNDGWMSLEPNARSVTLVAPSAAGTYEVRLHGNYPTRRANVVMRAKLVVK